MANIKVAVRVRPISPKEMSLTGSEVVVRTDLNEIFLTNLKVPFSKAGDSRERKRKYTFDYCFDSSNPEAEHFADQTRIYQTVGHTVLDAVFSGYNSCLVAYGQSASGKTYTMMGTKEEPGLTPRLCEGLFTRIEEERKHDKTYCVLVSYLEIYNERVRDLLKPSTNTGGLRVREHPRLGPYVQGLTHHKISTLASLMSYVEEGTKARKTASTQQNPSSSRSHALLTIAVAVESEGVAGGIPSSSSKKKIPSRGESKLRLVDLAGSECAATCSGIYRLKESANINKSLVALGNVISALAERGSTRNGPGRRFIPYRDSSLTWLLKDALGGNATTIMLATISPACGSYNETAHTLRFAQRAQSVVNRPTINEDPVARVVRELRAEVTRLKALLLEKNVELDGKNMCICHKNLTQDSSDLNDGMKAELHKLRNGEEFDEQRTTSRAEKRKELNSIIPLQRSNSSNNVIPLEIDRPMKKCNSFEVLVATDRFDGPYNCANVTEIKDEEQEVNEIHESVFVDIPTLVAVLIKPDDHLQQSTTQIEEICSDEVVETLIDVEDVEEYEDHEIPEIVESVDWQNGSNSVTSNHIPPGNEVEDFEKTQLFGENSTFNLKQRSKFRKQESVDSIATSVFSNLNTSRRFGSVETFQEKKDSVSPLSRSHTNLEKRSASVLENVNKLNDIREIDHHKDTNKHNWKVSKKQFQRKISIDSDRSLKETGAPSNTNIKDNTWKRSLDNFKRKDSKDSSSSSSKDEQILISNTTREKLLHRKDSIDQELASIRNHTPIQRAKRAEIVAAVTERLYSTRKQAEDALATRSPPENNEVKPAMKMKLQEISRRMLGKRRRVCVDTQTDCSRTVRMKDSASSTEMPQVICQDIGILTDHHVDCNYVVDNKAPVKRVKEISTLTEKPNTNIIRCKDATTLTNNHRGNDYDIDSSRNDSGVLSDDTQNHAESNSSSTIVSNLCQEANRKVACTDNSTNTRSFSSSRGFAVQTLQEEDGAQQILPNKVTIYAKQCYNGIEKSRDPMNKSESNVISICLPNTINITIENVNFPEPSVVIAYNESTTENDKFHCKDEEAQTDKRDDALMEIHGSKDRTRSMLNQTDGKVFRIENIFQDPNNVANSSKVDRVMGGMRIRNSITFRNSLGTSYMYQPKELKLNSAENVVHDEEFIRGLITEAFIHKKRNFNGRNSPSLVDYQNSWKDRFVQDSSKNINSVDHVSEKEVSLSPSQIKIDENNFSLRVNSTNDSILYDEPSCSSMSCNLDYDYGFSDDSLDYNENNQSKDAQETSEVKQLKDQSDNLCPPDVVAHIKGKCSQSPMESEKNEVTSDFDDSLSESATKSLTESVENTKQHDFESLIFDRVCQSYDEVTDDSDSSMSLLNYPEKKVSFPNIHISQEKYSAKQDTSATLKSIIKNDKNKVVDDPWNVIHSLNGVGTDDSQQEKKSSTVFDNDWRGKIKPTSSEEVKVDKDSVEFKRNSNKNRKKVKFSVKESLQNTCSESDNYENMVDESKNENIFSSTGKNIFEEYLSEAVTFMRNFNLFNGNVSSRNTRERCRPFSCCGSQGYPATCRCSCVWNCNYLEYLGRKVNQKGDICNSVEDDDIVPSTASYERCLRGVQRLEECIQKIGRHNETLKEKYGFNCESASARLDLASSSTEHCASTTRDDSFKAFQEAHIPLERDYHRKEEKTKEDEDLEKTIFRQLMNAANNTIEHRRSNRLRDRLSKISDSTANNLSGSGKLQTEDNQQTKGSRCGDVTTSLSVERIPDGNCNENNFTMYEITGNVSIGKPRTPEDNHNDSHFKLDDCLLLSKGFDCFSDLDYTNRTVSKVSENRKVDDSDSLNYMYNTKVLCPVSRMSTDNIYEKFQEVDSYSRRGKDRIFSSGSSFSSCICSKHHLGIDKLKFSKSPRATLMELLHERRRIVECSRGTSLF